jgi:hypothetical protein
MGMMTYIDNRGLFGGEIEIQTGLRPVPFFLTLIGVFGIVVAILFGMVSCATSASAASAAASAASADNDTQSAYCTISGVIKDIEMWREDDDCTSILIKFEDGRLLKTWCHYKNALIFYAGDYNELTLLAESGQVCGVKKKQGVVD